LVGSCNGFFRAFDKNSGKLAWVYDTKQDGAPLEFHGNPFVTSDLVIVGSDQRSPSGRAFIYAFERATGKLRWKYPAGSGTMSDILSDGSSIYAVTLADELVCLDIVTGGENWKYSSGVTNDDFLVTSSPALSAGRVFFGGMDGAVAALDAKSGSVIWKRDLGVRVSTSVEILNDSLYVGTIAGRLYRLATSTGAIISEYPLNTVPQGELVVTKDSVLVSLGSQSVICLHSNLKRLRWTKKAVKEWTTARPYLWRDAVLLADHGNLFAFKLSDGSDVWANDFGDVVRGIGSDSDILYVGTLKGTLYAYRR